MLPDITTLTSGVVPVLDNRAPRMRRLLFCLFMALSVIPSAASADCVDGIRKVTARETDYFLKTRDALTKALPAPPAGWTITFDADQTLAGLCKGTPEGGFSIRAGALYRYRPPKDEAARLYAEHRRIEAEIDALEKLPSHVMQQRTDLLARYSEQTRLARAAEREGDRSAAHHFYEEREKLARQTDELRNSHLAKIKPQIDVLRSRQKEYDYGTQEVRVQITVNDRFPAELNPNDEDEIVAGKMPAPERIGMKVTGLRMVLTGPAAKRRALKAAVNRKDLELLLQ